jgi:hypothetical protein
MHFNIILCFWAHLDSCSLLWTHFRGAALTEVDPPFIFIDKETLSFRSKGISYIDIIKLIY